MEKEIIKSCQELYTCLICQKIAFPPVKWNTVTPINSTPKCNHIYCLECTKIYFSLEKSKIRYNCLSCQKVLQSEVDTYNFCTYDEDNLVNILIKINGEERKCSECDFTSDDLFLMKNHILRECSFIKYNCKYKKNGCNEKLFNAELNLHENICDYKTMECLFCHQLMINKDIKYHMKSYHYVHNNDIDISTFTRESNKVIKTNITGPTGPMMNSYTMTSSYPNVYTGSSGSLISSLPILVEDLMNLNSFGNTLVNSIMNDLSSSTNLNIQLMPLPYYSLGNTTILNNLGNTAISNDLGNIDNI